MSSFAKQEKECIKPPVNSIYPHVWKLSVNSIYIQMFEKDPNNLSKYYVSEKPFNPLMPVGNKKVTHT